MTSRAAEAVLGTCAGLTRRHARRVLAGGLAGSPLRAGRLLLHDPERVRELAGRSFVAEHEVDSVTTELVVLRRDVDVTADRGSIVSSLADGWDLSAFTRVALRARIERAGGGLPVVATTAGFVTAGAELTEVTAGGRHASRLTLTDPGPWFEVFRDRRYATGPGRPWWIRGWQPGTVHTRPPPTIGGWE